MSDGLPAPVVSATAQPAELIEEDGGWSFLWWLVPILLLGVGAVLALLWWRIGREETIEVEKIEPYRPPQAAEAAKPSSSPAPSPAPQPDSGGFVTTNLQGRLTGRAQPQRRPAPQDGGVYARPIRRF